MANEISQSQQDENKFWLQILGDKARIILKELYTTESELVSRAEVFIKTFDGLLGQAADVQEQQVVNAAAWQAVQEFRKYVLELIKTQISLKTVIGILPEYLGVYVNECEMYLTELDAANKGKPFTINALDIALVWMMNSYLGAIHLEDNIGVTFVDYKSKASNFAHGFLVLYLRAQVLNGFLRTGLTHFAMLDAFYNDIAAHMTRYAEFVVDLIQLMEKRSFVGTLSLLDLDDLYRILCYIMKQLSSVSSIRPAVCDPAAQRRE